jgi:hypothetical protein
LTALSPEIFHRQLDSFFIYIVPILSFSRNGSVSLPVPECFSPLDLTICMDVESNPGPGPELSSRDLTVIENLQISNPVSCQPAIISYSRSELFDLRRYSNKHFSYSTDSCFSVLKHLGIFRYRGKRGGCRTRVLSSAVLTKFMISFPLQIIY